MSSKSNCGPLVASEARIRAAIQIDIKLVDAMEQAFAALAAGRVDLETAAIEGWDTLAIRVGHGFIDNTSLGMVVLDVRTGETKAILMDNGYFTELRTAATGAVAARHLAPEKVRRAGVLGCGVQARLQLQALQVVRRFESAIIWGSDVEKAGHCAREMSAILKVPVTLAASPEQVVTACDVIVTTTTARDPLVCKQWLRSGTHITAVGSDANHKGQLESAVLNAADLIVCDRLAQCEQHGEIHHAFGDAPRNWREKTVELGSLVCGQSAIRREESYITICDLAGTEVLDTAIARHALAALLGKSERHVA